MTEDDKQPGAAVFNSSKNKQAKAKAKWSLKKKLTVIGGVFVTVLIVLLLVVTLATSAPVKVSNQLIADIQSNDSTAGYALMSSGAQGVTSQEEFTADLNRISPILNSKPKMISKEITGQTGNAATAKVVYKIHGNDGVDYKLTVNLTKDNGVWKVQNFESVKD